MARKYIEKIQEAGHKVSLVTSRPKRLQASGREIDVERKTHDWVHRHFGDFLTVEVLGQDIDELTEKVAEEHLADFFVDDDPAALERLVKLRAKTQPFAFDQPWNQSWAGDRVYDWGDLHDFVMRESSRLRAVLE